MSNKIATLKFNLEDPDAARDFKLAVMSESMGMFIWELRNNTLRKIYKNGLDADQAIDLIQAELDELPFDINDLII